ncbi:unnamed protein product [Brassicogethes aeneus]|uniref:TGF-beta propeptide domain-containing protein n=1 Tax=Brassicogethes aeneus TaxID=1431903 RepID=A0A9P0AWD6_BRAAE|nr:unnamed protein product [Brassicogethes aeneus]
MELFGIIITIFSILITFSKSAPLNKTDLDDFVKFFYEKKIKSKIESDLREFLTQNNDDIYENMQGDQPATDQRNTQDILTKNNSFDDDAIRKYIRNSHRERDGDLRVKENWIKQLKLRILNNIGRGNSTNLMQNEDTNIPVNESQYDPGYNNNMTAVDEDNITEKIRSFYPSCDVPQNTDQDIWKDDNLMNLYFNFDYSNYEQNSKIATATLRLYRIPFENSTKLTLKNDCDNSSSTEDEKLRVSIYWYTKSLKKRRVKRRLSDSKVISDSALWVELDVKPATKAWGKGKNLGLGVLVEDQDGTNLKAEKYFKGPECTVGMPTPKPIPTIIVDAFRKNGANSNQLFNVSRNVSNPAFSSDLQLLPTIDICTLGFPENQSMPFSQIANLRINACDLKKFQEQSEKLAEKEKLERLVSLTLPSNRHIRHQRQHHLQNKPHAENTETNFDPRSRVINSRVIMTNEEVFNLTKLQM